MGKPVRKKQDLVASVVAQQWPRLIACAENLGIPPSDAPDAVQNTVVQAWQSENIPDNPDETRFWIFNLLKWESMTQLNNERRSREDLCAEADDIGNFPSGLDVEGVVTDRELVKRAMPRLTARYREVLERHYWKAEDVEQIAAALGTSKEDVWQRLSRAHKKLRAIIDELDRGDFTRGVALLPLLALLSLSDAYSSDGAEDPNPRNGPRTSAGRPMPRAPKPAHTPQIGPTGAKGAFGSHLGLCFVVVAAIVLVGDMNIDSIALASPTTRTAASPSSVAFEAMGPETAENQPERSAVWSTGRRPTPPSPPSDRIRRYNMRRDADHSHHQ